MALCRASKLEHADMSIMCVGECLDYVEEYSDLTNPKDNKKSKTRKATQADFDKF